RFARQMVRLLDGALAHPDAPLSAVDLLPDEERAWLAEVNRTDRDFSARTALEMFDGWVARTPDAPALAFEGERLTFTQLDARARHVAR
ncbi:hypothetical protein, partial [Escherichia coli]|uniref:hypothetical protein n=1 Tax=Escherichia coli TaxID=562 RepID=UPI0028E00298